VEINCAHPSHFEKTLRNGSDWLQRIRDVRANASRRIHAELDEAEELDDGTLWISARKPMRCADS